MPQLLPHGWYSLGPPVLATMAWVSSLFQDGCDYAILRGDDVVQAYAAAAPFLEVGFDAYRIPEYDPDTNSWKIRYTGQCLDYPDTPVDIDSDPYWTAAKFLDFMSAVLGGAGAFFLWFATCCVFSPGTWRWTGYEVGAAALCQWLTFLWFRNELCTTAGSCSMSWGAKMDIVAGTFWAVAAILILAHYPHAEWHEEEEEEDEYSYDDEEGDDHHHEDAELPPYTGDHPPDNDNQLPHEMVFTQSASQFSGEASYEEEPKGMQAKIV